MLARKRPAVGSIRTLELDGKTYTKLNEGGRHDDVGRGVRLSLRRWLLPFACLFGRMVQALATILLRTGHKPGAARRVDIKQRNALNRRGHPPD
jgi:hypothetical protein